MTSQIARTEGLVIRNLRYGDTSRVATLFTPEFGKISVIGKGVREPGSPFGASLELFARSEYVLYFRSGRNLQMLKSGDVLEVHRGLQESPFRFVYGSAVLEFLDRMLLEEEPSRPLYTLALRALARIQTVNRQRVRETFRAFQLRAASILGYGLLLDACLHCGRSIEGAGRESGAASRTPRVPDGGDWIWLFRPGEGGALCPSCARHAESGHPLTVRALLRIRSMVSADLRSGEREMRIREPEPGSRDADGYGPLSARPVRDAREPASAVIDGSTDARPLRTDAALTGDGVSAGGTSDAELLWAEALDRIVEDFLHFHVERYRGLRSLRVGGS